LKLHIKTQNSLVFITNLKAPWKKNTKLVEKISWKKNWMEEREPCWTGTTRSKEDRKCLRHRIFLRKEKEHPQKQDQGCQERIVATYVTAFSVFLRLFETHEGTKILVFSRHRFPFFFFFLFPNPNGITEFKDWTELIWRVGWAQENEYVRMYMLFVVAETPIYRSQRLCFYFLLFSFFACFFNWIQRRVDLLHCLAITKNVLPGRY